MHVSVLREETSRREKHMTVTSRFVLAAVLTSALATPVLAGEWRYHGGPKAPDSAASYSDWYAYDNGYGAGYGAPAYGYAYGYADRPYIAGPAYYGDTYGRPLGYRDGPATSDYYNYRGQLQGTR